MQLKQFAAACVLFIALPISGLKAQNLDEVLKNHFEAVGQKSLSDVQTLTTHGKLNQQGIDIPFTQILARPGKMRVEGTFQGLTFIQVFNGTEGWSVNPFAGSTAPEPIPADQLDDIKLQSDLDGMLWNYKEKGYNVTLDGTEDVEGTPCYKITVITPDTTTYVEYIDTESYMMIKSHSKVKMMGVDVEADTYFSNYMQKEGMAFPGRIENRYNGTTGEVITIDSIEINTKYENAVFDKPQN